MYETIVLPMKHAGVTRILGVKSAERDLISMTRKGLPSVSALRLAEAGGLTEAQLAAALGISSRTLARKRGKRRLNAVESDRAIRLARVLALALEVLGNRKAAAAWLHDPIIALGGRAPVDLLDTDTGLRSVERELVLLDYGGIS